ncbi:hypothetical protein GGX14DRAFT_655546 [Mycena pura]|uniref:Uncharacterized protein n=1 Tax=Mycena pura TaxID=153505 RepID=A0AAD6V7C7_9AGAR|nr:hypothetical protein GGX14DRAFT_655546 [Mycena pura]
MKHRHAGNHVAFYAACAAAPSPLIAVSIMARTLASACAPRRVTKSSSPAMFFESAHCLSMCRLESRGVLGALVCRPNPVHCPAATARRRVSPLRHVAHPAVTTRRDATSFGVKTHVVHPAPSARGCRVLRRERVYLWHVIHLAPIASLSVHAASFGAKTRVPSAYPDHHGISALSFGLSRPRRLPHTPYS